MDLNLILIFMSFFGLVCMTFVIVSAYMLYNVCRVAARYYTMYLCCTGGVLCWWRGFCIGDFRVISLLVCRSCVPLHRSTFHKVGQVHDITRAKVIQKVFILPPPTLKNINIYTIIHSARDTARNSLQYTLTVSTPTLSRDCIFIADSAIPRNIR